MKDPVESRFTAALRDLEGMQGIQIGGKKGTYLQVKDRVHILRRHFGADYGIETEELEADEPLVKMRAVIRDINGRVIATGTAEERRGDGPVNKTSAVENAETSAIGRALAAFGLGGSEYASINEMEGVERKEAVLVSTDEAFAHGLGSSNDPGPSPGIRWQEWVREQINIVEQHLSLATHKVWRATNEQLLDQCVQHDRELATKLLIVIKDAEQRLT